MFLHNVICLASAEITYKSCYFSFLNFSPLPFCCSENPEGANDASTFQRKVISELLNIFKELYSILNAYVTECVLLQKKKNLTECLPSIS